MSTIFSMNQMIPVPASVAVCPDCNGPMLVDLYELAPFLEEANLWAPGDCFGLECTMGHIWETDRRDHSADLHQMGWNQVYDNVSGWFSQTPFLVECDIKQCQCP